MLKFQLIGVWFHNLISNLCRVWCVVVELKTGDNVKDAIELLYTKNASGAPIADDVIDPDNITVGRFSDRYIGFIDLATMLLWSLDKCENAGDETDKCSTLLSLLQHNPQIGHTKVCFYLPIPQLLSFHGELIRSFLFHQWNLCD